MDDTLDKSNRQIILAMRQRSGWVRHCCGEARRACAPQRNEPNTLTRTKALEIACRIMVDAVHREHHQLRPRYRGSQQSLAILEATAVLLELTAMPQYEVADCCGRTGSAAHVEKSTPAQLGIETQGAGAWALLTSRSWVSAMASSRSRVSTCRCSCSNSWRSRVTSPKAPAAACSATSRR
jgi:hypothetical protein